MNASIPARASTAALDAQPVGHAVSVPSAVHIAALIEVAKLVNHAE